MAESNNDEKWLARMNQCVTQLDRQREEFHRLAKDGATKSDKAPDAPGKSGRRRKPKKSR
jgi:hypothetical protein